MKHKIRLAASELILTAPQYDALTAVCVADQFTNGGGTYRPVVRATVHKMSLANVWLVTANATACMALAKRGLVDVRGKKQLRVTLTDAGRYALTCDNDFCAHVMNIVDQLRAEMATSKHWKNVDLKEKADRDIKMNALIDELTAEEPA